MLLVLVALTPYLAFLLCCLGSLFLGCLLSCVVCGWFCAVCSKCLLCFCVDGEVFEGDFEIVFVAFLRPTYLPIALAEFSVDELLWDADVGHVKDVA